MKQKSLWSVLVFTLVVSMVLAGCTTPTPEPEEAEPTQEQTTEQEMSSEGSEAEGEPIKIGLPVILTGANTYVFGEMVRAAATLAVEEINAEGGVLGRPLELVVQDDAGDPKEAVAVAHSYCGSDDVVAVIGHTFSGTTIPTLPVYDECNMPQLELGSNPRITEMGYDHEFRITAANDLITGQAAADHAVEEFGIESVAVIHNKTMWGKAVATVFMQRCEELGVEVTTFQGVDPESVDFSPTMTMVNNDDPDAIYFAGYGEAGLARNQMCDLGMDQIWLAAEAISSEYVDTVGECGIGTTSATAAPPLDFRPETREFAAAFEERFDDTPQTWSPAYYDAVYAIAEAIRVAGEASREGIRQALYEVEIPSVTHPSGMAWNEKGEVKYPVTFVWQLQDDLTFDIIYVWEGEPPYDRMSEDEYHDLVFELLGE